MATRLEVDMTRSRNGAHDPSAAALAAALRRELRGEVAADAYSRHLFATDASMYAAEPLLVAFPRDAADVAAAVERRRPLTACRSSAAAPARASSGRRSAPAGSSSTPRAT